MLKLVIIRRQDYFSVKTYNSKRIDVFFDKLFFMAKQAFLLLLQLSVVNGLVSGLLNYTQMFILIT